MLVTLRRLFCDVMVVGIVQVGLDFPLCSKTQLSSASGAVLGRRKPNQLLFCHAADCTAARKFRFAPPQPDSVC
jgi:hypothetical protein